MDPNQQPEQTPAPAAQPQTQPQPPSSYAPPVESSYDPNYLDSIAPAAPRAKFLSGTFGKVFWVLIGIFVLAVSLIIAFSGKDDTADLQQMSVRLDNFSKSTKLVNKHFKSKNLKIINGTFMIWLSDNQGKGEGLLKSGGVKKTDYNKQMVKDEAKLAQDLDEEFEDARLAGKLNRIYANTMAYETDKLLNMLNSMSKKSKSKQIREYAKRASASLVQIHKDFEDYVDDGN